MRKSCVLRIVLDGAIHSKYALCYAPLIFKIAARGTYLFIDLLCKTFSVNKEWLISGTGDMFISSADNILNQLSKEYKLDPTDEAIIKTYLSFGADERKIIKRYITETAERIVSSDDRDKFIAADIAATEMIAEKMDVNMRQQTKVTE